jgi:hypothetical protein
MLDSDSNCNLTSYLLTLDFFFGISKGTEERIKSLELQVAYWINNVNTKTVEIIELFY